MDAMLKWPKSAGSPVSLTPKKIFLPCGCSEPASAEAGAAAAGISAAAIAAASTASFARAGA